MAGDMIIEKAVYIYTSENPPQCQGHHYRVVRARVLNVPTRNHLVLVEALTGPDAGLMFTCTPANFERRYARLPNQDTNGG